MTVKLWFHRLLACVVSNKKPAVTLVCSTVPKCVFMPWLLLAFSFDHCFEEFDYDVPWYNSFFFFHVSGAWHSLSFWNLWIYIFKIKIGKFLAIILKNVFGFPPIPVRILITHVLGCLTLSNRSPALSFYLILSFSLSFILDSSYTMCLWIFSFFAIHNLPAFFPPSFLLFLPLEEPRGIYLIL